MAGPVVGMAPTVLVVVDVWIWFSSGDGVGGVSIEGGGSCIVVLGFWNDDFSIVNKFSCVLV